MDSGIRTVFKYRSALLLILAVGLILRFAVIGLAPVPVQTGVMTADDNRYDALAWNVAQGLGFTNYNGQQEFKDPPLLPLVSAGIYFVFGHNRLWMFILQALVATATIGLVYLLARRFFGEPAGLAAALLTGIYPDLVLYTNILLTETFFIFLLCAAMVCWIWALDQRDWRRWALAGIVLGLTALTRPTAELLVVLLLPVSVWFQYRRAGSRTQIASLAIYTLAFLITLAPWTVRNYLALHALVPVSTGAGIALWIGTNVAWNGRDVKGEQSIYGDPDYVRVSTGDPITSDQRMLRESLEHMLRNPVGVATLLPSKFMHMNKGPSSFGFYFKPGDPRALLLRIPMLLLYGLVVILGILGSAIAWRRQRPALVLLSVPIVYLTLLTLLTIPAQRYMLPAIPFFIVLASLPVSTCVNSRVLSRHPFRDAPVTLKRITS